MQSSLAGEEKDFGLCLRRCIMCMSITDLFWGLWIFRCQSSCHLKQRVHQVCPHYRSSLRMHLWLVRYAITSNMYIYVYVYTLTHHFSHNAPLKTFFFFFLLLVGIIVLPFVFYSLQRRIGFGKLDTMPDHHGHGQCFAPLRTCMILCTLCFGLFFLISDL